jgi:hypothetical protein
MPGKSEPPLLGATAGIMAYFFYHKIMSSAMPDPLTFAFRQDGKRHFATPVGGSEFYLGRETKFGGRVGLGRAVAEYWGARFRAADHPAIGHWAELLELTGHCESGNTFNCINTYDRAGFTFGFCQLGAHTPDDNLILLLRRAAALPEAPTYLPGMFLQSGKLRWRDPDGSILDLEATGQSGGELQNLALMRHLNPDGEAVGEAERRYVARLSCWSERSAEFRRAQVEVAQAILAKKMRVYESRYGLDGRSDAICAIVADIHHQGRAKVSAVRRALAVDDPKEALIVIDPSETGRIANLRAKLAEMEAAGRLGLKRYRAASNEFG